MKELVKECLAGNQKAQKTLYEKFANRMMAVCLRYIPDRGLAEDTFQDAFLKVFQNLDKFQGENLEGYIRRIFINESINAYHRKFKLNAGQLSVDNIHYHADDSQHLPFDGLSLEEITSCINKLPEGSKVVFNLFAVEGFEHKEIATMLGVTEGTSKSQYHRARKLLMAMLSPTPIENNNL